MTTTVNLGTPTGTFLLVERDPRPTETSQGVIIPTGDPRKAGVIISIGNKVEAEYDGLLKEGGRIQWLYDLPCDSEIPHDGDEEIVILDASDVALILE